MQNVDKFFGEIWLLKGLKRRRLSLSKVSENLVIPFGIGSVSHDETWAEVVDISSSRNIDDLVMMVDMVVEDIDAE